MPRHEEFLALGGKSAMIFSSTIKIQSEVFGVVALKSPSWNEME